MDYAYILLQFSVLVCICVHLAYGDYTVTVDLQTYHNPTHMRAQSNDCCDSNCNPCDNRFRFCFTDSTTDVEMASVLQAQAETVLTKVDCPVATGLVAMDNDNITFASSKIFGDNTRNPLTFQGDVWPGVGFLLVLVFDVDSETLDDTVDAIIVPILPSSLGQYSPSRPYDGVFEFGTLTARYRVDCDDTFFGEDCSVSCVARDNADGHYTCDDNGNRKCLKGYRNPSTFCTECVPATGCSPVGGYCSLPGNCICLPGFTGGNCTEAQQDDRTQCNTTSSSSSSSSSPSNSRPVAVYVLGAVVGALVLILFAVFMVVIILSVCLRRRGKVGSINQSSRDYSINESAGSTVALTTAADTIDDGASERSSRQYATVDTNKRLAQIALNHIPHHDVLDNTSSTASSAASTPVSNAGFAADNDVPRSSLQANIAYGIEQKRQRGGIVNGIRAPMRPPPRPPHK